MKTLIHDADLKRFNDRMGEVNPSRRVVLRNALAVGCGLMLPSILIGCDSRNGESATVAAPADAPDTGADAGAESAAPAAPGKVTQASVQYQNQPKGAQQCSGCTHFLAETSSCKLVEGQISPDAWCMLWVQKA